jgi:hypothetical protein
MFHAISCAVSPIVSVSQRRHCGGNLVSPD